MKAMVLDQPGQPLQFRELPVPTPLDGQVLLRVLACGVCRTDLHVVDGELPSPKTPLIPGHEIVGEVVACGSGGGRLSPGARVGVPWLGKTCGDCFFCRNGQENLCDRPQFTGYTFDGGYAEYAVAYEDYCLPIPARFNAVEAAPLLCAGLIGYRSLNFAGNAKRLGIYGFGAAAHIVAQVARSRGSEVYAFTRPGDRESQEFALRLGAQWAGASTEPPPVALDAAILFAPVGGLVPLALKAVRKGGVVVCGGIHMSPIPEFAYDLLWGERQLRSVANLTRRDGQEFMGIAEQSGVRTETVPFPLAEANVALDQLRRGKLTGAAVIIPTHT
jgi:alcohol dehydrogenase, propanol-preferring